MTRKDYALIAAAIKSLCNRNYSAEEMRIAVAEAIATAFASENGRFDWERFMKACEAAP